MISTKSIEYSIEVTQPCKFCADKRKNIEKYINDNLVGTCFQGCMILELLQLNNISMCRVINTDRHATSVINVIFTCKALYYPSGSIIPKAKIRRNDATRHIIAVADHVVVAIAKDASAKHEMLKDGHVIPIVVDKQEYDPGENMVTVYGSILTCRKNVVYWHTSGGLSDADIKTVKRLVAELHSLDHVVNDKKYEPVASLLYPYKEHKKMSGVRDIVNMASSSEDITGIWYRDLSVPLESTYVNNKADEAIDDSVVSLTPIQLIVTLLYSVINIRKAIDMITREYTEDHEYLWNIMRYSKVDAKTTTP